MRPWFFGRSESRVACVSTVKYNREDAKITKIDTEKCILATDKKPMRTDETSILLFFLRVYLRDLRVFAVAFIYEELP